MTLDYFPLNSKSAWQPYIGVGLNYTIFYSEGTSTELDTALNDSDARLDLTNSLGIVVRAGLDYKINDRWGLNATAYWIDIDTEATIESSAATVDVEIDPFVYLLGISYKF